jgi:hypothetical protein
MFPRRLAALLAVVALGLPALNAAAQPRAGGWGGRGFPGAGRFGGFGGGRFGGYPGGGRGGFVPPGGGWGRQGFAPGGALPPVRGPGFGAFGGGDWRGQQEEVRRAVREGRHVPLGQAIEAVRRRAPGRELDAGLEPGPNGRPVYRLRWAGQNGRRQDYMVDAETGAVLGVEGGP